MVLSLVRKTEGALNYNYLFIVQCIGLDWIGFSSVLRPRPVGLVQCEVVTVGENENRDCDNVSKMR